MNFAVIIPAQETNQYHINGDLAPFGDTTLLEWKLTQCKEFVDNSYIYVLTSSEKIKKIAKNENVQLISKNSDEFETFITDAVSNIDAETIMICNVTTPFIDAMEYQKILQAFSSSNSHKSLVVIKKLYEYVLFEGEKLNFHDNFMPRNKLSPVDIICNGIYLFDKENFMRTKLMIEKTPLIYELDDFSSIEIKNVLTYQISNNLITYFFQKELNV